jgi:3-isopropylmalate/(R)-2-methylmalate dehydratase small subunit
VTNKPVREVNGRAAVLRRANIDTDVIIRVERMVSTDPAALAAWAFEALRYRDDGTEDPGFVLNTAPFKGAPILVVGPNFGCGSSREPAVWAMQGLGIKVVVGPSFGDIFEANCHQNGMLPVTLDQAEVNALAAIAETAATVSVDVETQQIQAGGRTWDFALGPTQKMSLLDGLDDLDLALRDMDAVRAWEHADRRARPWAWAPLTRASSASTQTATDSIDSNRGKER